MSGHVESFRVAATLAAQRIVQHVTATVQTVQYPANLTTTVALVGITIDDVEDTTSAIPVQINGIAKLYFNDSVSSGALVTADTSGRGVPWAGVTAATWFIGSLVGPAVDTTGTIAEVLINPGLASSE